MQEYPTALAQAILASMTEGVMISDVHGNIVDMNSAAMKLHGFQSKESVCKNYAQFVEELVLLTPDECVLPAADWPAARAMRGEKVAGYELIVRNIKTGQSWRNVYSGSAVKDTDGVVVRFVLTMHDISFERNLRRLIQEKDDAFRAEQKLAALELEQVRSNQWQLLSDVLRNVTEGKLRLCRVADELPPLQPNCGDNQPLTHQSGISGLRSDAKQAAEERGFDDARWQDLVTAVGEAAMNAIVHGGGGEACVCGNNSKVQVWIEDKGEGITVNELPHATLGKGYTTAGTLGQGMKLMLQTIDRLYLLTGASGTTVVLEQDKIPEPPAWLMMA